MDAPQRVFKKSLAQYPVIVKADVSGGYWVSCPVFEGCYSQGETIDETLGNIKEAILLCAEEGTTEPQLGEPVSLHI